MTHDDLGLGVGGPHDADHLGERRDDIVDALALEHVVGAEHEHDDVGGCALQPVGQVAVSNVDGQPARVALVVLVPVGRRRLAVLRVAVLRPDVLHLVREPGRRELVPHERPPASDLGDTVAEGHWPVSAMVLAWGCAPRPLTDPQLLGGLPFSHLHGAGHGQAGQAKDGEEA